MKVPPSKSFQEPDDKEEDEEDEGDEGKLAGRRSKQGQGSMDEGG